ncbi:MAG TPA: DUF1573 domain-containing protein [Tepidisphaeraceae bacterium]|nr:DUF1573 domain-containing protein [Tepidisphaeraceae bacterium]
MRTTIILLFLLVFAPLAFAQLKFESETVKLTATQNDNSVKGEFKFKNEGKYAVTIKNLETSCSCTTAALAKKTYQPGESGTISTEFTIGQHDGQVVEKMIYVTTDDLKHEMEILTLQTDVPKLFEIERKFTYWKPGEARTPKTVKIKVVAKDPIQLTAVKPESDKLSAELKEITPGREYQVTITPNDTSKALTQRIDVATNLATDKKIVPLYLRIGEEYSDVLPATQASSK